MRISSRSKAAASPCSWSWTPHIFLCPSRGVDGRERERSRSRDGDISGAFGATYLHRISQLPRHFLKRATHYQTKKIQGNLWGDFWSFLPHKNLFLGVKDMKNLILMLINDSVTHVFCPGMFLFLAEEHKVGTSACFGLKIDPESSECCPHWFILFPHFHSCACAACCCGRARTCYLKHQLFFLFCWSNFGFFFAFSQFCGFWNGSVNPKSSWKSPMTARQTSLSLVSPANQGQRTYLWCV